MMDDGHETSESSHGVQGPSSGGLKWSENITYNHMTSAGLKRAWEQDVEHDYKRVRHTSGIYITLLECVCVLCSSL